MVEQAKYEVLKEITKVEIRRYQTMVIARVDGLAMAALTFSLVSLRAITGKNQKLR
jgi:hypothetical protein